MNAGLTAWLESLDDAQLARVVESRRDLLSRPPAGLRDLEQRLSASSSVSQALFDLDGRATQVAGVLASQQGQATVTQLRALLRRSGSVPRGHVEEALASLHDAGVAWPLSDGKTWSSASGVTLLVPSLLELGHSFQHLLVGPTMPALRSALSLLGLPEVATGWQAVQEISDLLRDAVAVKQVLATAPAGVAVLMEALATGAQTTSDDPAEGWLRDRLLLLGGQLPAELIAYQRGDRIVPSVRTEPALLPPTGAVADGQHRLLELLGQVRLLLRTVRERPLKSLADGGVGVQEQRRLARLLGFELPRTRWLLQLCDQADLLSRGHNAGSLTQHAGQWLGEEEPRAALVLAVAGLAQNVVADEVDGPVLARAWRGPSTGAPLAELAQLCDRPATEASLRGWLLWRRPGTPEEELTASLSLLEVLGLRAGGWPSPWLAPVLAGDLEEAEAALIAVLPPEQDEVVLQADGTAVVVGRPSEGLRTLLDLLATRESDRTWRVTPAGVQAALAAGWTGETLLKELTARSTHAVPQVLSVMVADEAARYGRIRVASATTVLAVEDDLLIEQLLRDHTLAVLELRLLRPGVLTSPKAADVVMTALRRAGHAPIGPPAKAHAVSPLSRPIGIVTPHTPTGLEIVQALRKQVPAPPKAGTGVDLDVLRWLLEAAPQLSQTEVVRLAHAIATGGALDIDYEDNRGMTVVRPVSGLDRRDHLLVSTGGWSFWPESILAVRRTHVS